MTTGVLLLAFGGPEPGCCGRRATCHRGGRPPSDGAWAPSNEAECFVAGILDDKPERLPRVREVAAHYQAVAGGFSPYNALTRAQAAALRAALPGVPVALGMRHWTPWVDDALRDLAAAGCDAVLPVILAPHQAGSAWDAYMVNARAAAARTPGAPRLCDPLPAMHDDPGFIAGCADHLRSTVAGWTSERRAAAALILTAHAIPVPAERGTPYRAQIAGTAAAVASAAGFSAHTVAFTSAPTDSRIPWSAPTVETAIAAAAAAGAREVVVQSIGFLVDHVEVLYDLDVAAQAAAQAAGIGYTRARCVNDHPAFIASLAASVRRALTVG